MNRPPAPVTGRWSAETAYLVTVVVSAFAFSVWGTFTTLYRFQDAGLTPLQLVLVGTTLEVAYFLFEVPTGVVADLVSRRLSVIVAYALMGAGFLVEGLWAWFPTILLAQVMWGIGATFESGALDAWLTGEVGKARVQAVILRTSQGGRLAAVAGIITAMALAELSLAWPLRIGGGIMLGLSLLLAWKMPERHFGRSAAPGTNGWHEMRRTAVAGVRAVRANRVLTLAFIIMAIFGFTSEARDRLWEAHVLEAAAFPTVAGLTLSAPTWFGLIAIVSLLIGLTLTEYVRRRVPVETQTQAVRAQMVLFGLENLFMILFALVTGFGWMIGAWLLRGMFGGTAFPIWRGWLNKEIAGIPPAGIAPMEGASPAGEASASDAHATVLSLLGQTNAIGQIVGGPPLGWVGTRFGLRWALLAVGVLNLPTLGLFAAARRATMQRG